MEAVLLSLLVAELSSVAVKEWESGLGFFGLVSVEVEDLRKPVLSVEGDGDAGGSEDCAGAAGAVK